MKETPILDNPFVSLLNFLADLMILNILTLLCCIPILTIGPAITAMHCVLFRIRKSESSSVVKEFFCAFRDNFCQAISLWVIYLIFGVIILADLYLIIIGKMQLVMWLQPLVYLATVLLIMSVGWAFLFISRYDNKLIGTIVNACYLGIAKLPQTMAIVIFGTAPILLLAFCPFATPIVLLVGFSMAGYVQTFFYIPVFEKLRII